MINEYIYNCRSRIKAEWYTDSAGKLYTWRGPNLHNATTYESVTKLFVIRSKPWMIFHIHASMFTHYTLFRLCYWWLKLTPSSHFLFVIGKKLPCQKNIKQDEINVNKLGYNLWRDKSIIYYTVAATKTDSYHNCLLFYNYLVSYTV